MDSSPLIPDIPSSPVNKDQSSSDEDFPAERSTPANKRPTKEDRIHLEQDTYKKVRGHADTLKGLQSKVIALTKEISQVDNAQSVPTSSGFEETHPDSQGNWTTRRSLRILGIRCSNGQAGNSVEFGVKSFPATLKGTVRDSLKRNLERNPT